MFSVDTFGVACYAALGNKTKVKHAKNVPRKDYLDESSKRKDLSARKYTSAEDSPRGLQGRPMKRAKGQRSVVRQCPPVPGAPEGLGPGRRRSVPGQALPLASSDISSHF